MFVLILVNRKKRSQLERRAARRYAKMLKMKSRNRLAYCSGWTVEISAPACSKEVETKINKMKKKKCTKTG